MPNRVAIRDDLYHAQRTSSQYRFKQSTIDWQGDLASQYTKLARKANTRLRNLEAYSHDKGFENIKSLAYKNAMHDIEIRQDPNDKKVRKRYKETFAPGLTQMQQIARIQDVLRFLNSVSSTKQGIQQVYQKGINTLNAKYPGLDMTWQEMARLQENGVLDSLKAKIAASDSMWEVIVNQRRSMKELQKILEDVRGKDEIPDEELEKIASILGRDDITEDQVKGINISNDRAFNDEVYQSVLRREVKPGTLGMH